MPGTLHHLEHMDFPALSNEQEHSNGSGNPRISEQGWVPSAQVFGHLPWIIELDLVSTDGEKVRIS